MKLAICYSGQYRTFSSFNWKENHHHITQYADKIFYSTWETESCDIPDIKRFQEPTIDYNPFEIKEFIALYPDTARVHKNNKNRYHLSKQVLAHQYIVDTIPEKYDMVIRMRYDTIVSQETDFEAFIKKSYKEQSVIGFGGWTGEIDRTLNNLNKIIIPDPSNSGNKTINSVNDFMIIHPRTFMKNADRLHQKKKLFPANHGWYQVLVLENKPILNFNYGGSVMLVRYFYP